MELTRSKVYLQLDNETMHIGILDRVLAVVPYNLGDGPSGSVRKARPAFGGNRRARQVQRSFQRPEQDEGYT